MILPSMLPAWSIVHIHGYYAYGMHTLLVVKLQIQSVEVVMTTCILTKSREGTIAALMHVDARHKLVGA